MPGMGAWVLYGGILRAGTFGKLGNRKKKKQNYSSFWRQLMHKPKMECCHLLNGNIDMKSKINLNRYTSEELYWQQRGSENWVLRGDSNAQFFQQHANGRRRKNLIRSLDSENGVLQSQEDIEQHITYFYKELFGDNTPAGIRLADNFWFWTIRVSAEDSMALTEEFSEKEVRDAIFGMKSASAPGPNGFGFFKTFWNSIKGDYLDMFRDFHRGDLDVKRLNYGVITLVPKVQEANTIKQYKPICLLNVDYKGITGC